MRSRNVKRLDTTRLAEKMLRNTRIERVLSQAFLAGLKREAVPWNYQSEIPRLRTDTAIALRDGDDFRC